jgi:hypothetical protein
MSDPVQMICDLAGCRREQAEAAFAETKDVVEAVDRLMAKPELKSQKYIPPKQEKVMTQAQVELKKLRDISEGIEKSRGPTLLSRSGDYEECS